MPHSNFYCCFYFSKTGCYINLYSNVSTFSHNWCCTPTSSASYFLTNLLLHSNFCCLYMYYATHEFWSHTIILSPELSILSHRWYSVQAWLPPWDPRVASCCTVQLRWKLAAQTKPNFDPLASYEELRCLEQLLRFHAAKNGIATHYRFSLWTEPARSCFHCIFSYQARPRARQIHTLERVATLFLGCDMTLRTPPAASKVHQQQWNDKMQEGWHKHPCAELGRTALGSPNSIYLSNPKNGHRTNRTI